MDPYIVCYDTTTHAPRYTGTDREILVVHPCRIGISPGLCVEVGKESMQGFLGTQNSGRPGHQVYLTAIVALEYDNAVSGSLSLREGLIGNVFRGVGLCYHSPYTAMVFGKLVRHLDLLVVWHRVPPVA